MDHTYANRATGDGAARQDWFCKDRSALNSQLPAAAQAPLFAELTGDTCTSAGLTVRSQTPILAMCRELIAAGVSPDEAIEIYRGGTLAVRVRSIGEAAALEINAKGTGFVRAGAVRTAPPMRQNGRCL